MLTAKIQSTVEKYPELQPVWQNVVADFDQCVKPPFVALLGAIIGQKISYVQAKALRSRLYKEFGTEFDSLTLLENTTRLQEIFQDYPDKLTIIHNILKQELDFNSSKIWKTLASLKGIGPWTISTIKITSCLEEDEFPSGDLFIRRRLQRLFNLPKLPTIKETVNISKRWQGSRTYVAWLLWRWF